MTEGAIITFGNYNWQVLDVEGGRALVITENIIALRWYHSAFVDITWAGCALRKYLNDNWYNTFTQNEKERILPVENNNPGNPWFNTEGGIPTTDHIFLLSLAEVCKYFGNSSRHLEVKGKQKWLIDDENNQRRQAKFGDAYHWWRLRSPGYYGRTAASINAAGHVYVRGNGVYGRPRDGGGLRPALWLKLENIDSA